MEKKEGKREKRKEKRKRGRKKEDIHEQEQGILLSSFMSSLSIIPFLLPLKIKFILKTTQMPPLHQVCLILMSTSIRISLSLVFVFPQYIFSNYGIKCITVNIYLLLLLTLPSPLLHCKYLEFKTFLFISLSIS